MKITLPTQMKEIKDGKLEKTESEQVFDLDMSLNAQIRYEAKFPDLAAKEDLFDYSKRIFAVKSQSSAVFISKLKLIYCWLDTDISFTEFLRLFDLTDPKYIEKLVGQLNTIFELVASESAEKN